MENIEKIRENVTKYCIRNQNMIIGFETMSNDDVEHIYNLAASVVLTRDKILPGGSFVQSIVDNDLAGAVQRADNIAIRGLRLLVATNKFFD